MTDQHDMDAESGTAGSGDEEIQAYDHKFATMGAAEAREQVLKTIWELADHWPEPARHDTAARALAGLLARAGWTERMIDQFVMRVARFALDAEWNDRCYGKYMVERLAAGADIPGFGSLDLTLVGLRTEDVLDRVIQWLGWWSQDLGAMNDGRRSSMPPPTTPVAILTALADLRLGAVWGEDPAVLALADYARRNVDAWFGGRIYAGVLNILDGDPGVGKTNLALALAACVSAGLALPDGSSAGPPASVLYFTAEDDVATTLKPRLEAMGGDAGRVFAVTTFRPRDPIAGGVVERLPTLRDLDWLAERIENLNVRLIIFDPLVAYLPPGVSANSDQDMRTVLTPLAALARRTRVAILGIRHLNKCGGGRAMYRGGGAIGITGAMRSALLVDHDPNDAARMVLACYKNNLGQAAESLGFQIVTGPEGMPLIQWLGVVPYTADALLRNSDGSASRGEKVEAAEEFLNRELADGRVLETTLRANAEAEGIRYRTLQRAKANLGIRAVKQPGDPHGPWWWVPPDGSQPPNRSATPDQPPAAI